MQQRERYALLRRRNHDTASLKVKTNIFHRPRAPYAAQDLGLTERQRTYNAQRRNARAYRETSTGVARSPAERDRLSPTSDVRLFNIQYSVTYLIICNCLCILTVSRYACAILRWLSWCVCLCANCLIS